MLIFPDIPTLHIEKIVVDQLITVTLHSTLPTAACPLCGESAIQLHSHYQRQLRDLPASGQQVRLVLKVRRFFCRNPLCSHKTFAERFPELTQPYAHGTLRLRQTLERLGLALGGEAGARLGQHLGLQSSPDTLLRMIRHASVPKRASAKIIGIDDWAYKRRLRYGTIICDLETGAVLEVLADRSVQTVATWLQEHPEVQIISRDRWSEYAAAARKGAPQAQQVADRWHLLSNFVESLTALLARSRAEIRQAMVSGKSEAEEPHAMRSSAHSQRHDQYSQVQALAEQAQSPAQIAARVGISERSVYRWLARGQVPDWQHRSRKASGLDPYKAYVLTRWQQGCRKGAELLRELQAQGYRGSERAVYRYLTFLQASVQAADGQVLFQEPFVAKQAVWLLIADPNTLDEISQHSLTTIRQSSPQVERAYQLAQAFTQMLRQRQGENLDRWLHDASESSLPELHQFAAGVQRDHAAVQAGLSLSYSNGLVEGQVNRLKLIKRSMYGRAKFDLLRQRVLCST